MDPRMLKAKEMMLKSELLKVQAQKLVAEARGGGQGQPPRR
jgi:hypothetical protein